MLPSMVGAPSGLPAGADTFNNKDHRYVHSLNRIILKPQRIGRFKHCLPHPADTAPKRPDLGKAALVVAVGQNVHFTVENGWHRWVGMSAMGRSQSVQ
ncbi:hypothetical protein FQZ97_990780 [compost metagenome]